MKEIIKKLQQDGTRFTIKGILTHKDEPKLFKVNLTQFNSGVVLHSIYQDQLFGEGMNVDKFGPTCVWLYSYDMFGRKTTFKINYKDVTIIPSEE